MALACETVHVTTAVMQYGYRIIEDLIEGMESYLGAHGYESVSEIVGKALPQIILADQLDRKSVSYPRFDRNKCIACGRCFLLPRRRPSGPRQESNRNRS
jgi:dihydropyrimidine dehydrogenase (NAD+) subunit PreA